MGGAWGSAGVGPGFACADPFVVYIRSAIDAIKRSQEKTKSIPAEHASQLQQAQRRWHPPCLRPSQPGPRTKRAPPRPLQLPEPLSGHLQHSHPWHGCCGRAIKITSVKPYASHVPGATHLVFLDGFIPALNKSGIVPDFFLS